MEFRRSGHRDERRRRVLIDEVRHQGAALGSTTDRGDELRSKRAAAPVQPYPEAALSPRQRRVVDVIPTRRWTMLLLLFVALSLVAGLESLYGYVALEYTSLRVQQIPAIDLAVRGNIATWFSAGLFLMAAVMGVLTYLIRRHRVDDYRGRYRMWYWMVPVFVVISLDMVADLQGSLRTVLLHVAGIPDYADAMLIWTASMTVILGAIGVRLAIEMRGCRLAVASLMLAGGCYAAVGAARLDWLLADGGVFRVMATTSSSLLGHVALFMALCLYARHVHREARGQVRPRVQKKGRRPDTTGAGKSADMASGNDNTERGRADSGGQRAASRRVRRPDSSTVRRDTAHAQPAPGQATTTQRPAASDTSAASGRRGKATGRVAGPADSLDGSDDDASGAAGQGGSSRKLSKAERRRLRKLRRQER